MGFLSFGHSEHQRSGPGRTLPPRGATVRVGASHSAPEAEPSTGRRAASKRGAVRPQGQQSCPVTTDPLQAQAREQGCALGAAALLTATSRGSQPSAPQRGTAEPWTGGSPDASTRCPCIFCDRTAQTQATDRVVCTCRLEQHVHRDRK